MMAHWDEVEARERELGHLAGGWRNLGTAAGSVTVGLQRIEIPPGRWSTPAHVHGQQEEIFYVLGGSGLSWQDGKTYEVGAGDCLVHLAGGDAHTLVGGPEGLDALAFGMRGWDEAPTLTRANAVWLGTGWVVLAGDEDHPWEREVAAGPPELPERPGERPGSIVNVAGVEIFPPRRRRTVHSDWRDLGRAAGSAKTGLRHVVVSPGRLSAPPHCHSAEEELFVVLEGEGTLELTPSPDRIRKEAVAETHPVHGGSVVSRPAGTGIAHAFRAGDAHLTLLAYGTRESSDVAYYPRSNKLFWRGVGVIGRVEHLDYWDGED